MDTLELAVDESAFMSEDEMLRISERVTNLILLFMYNTLAAERMWFYNAIDEEFITFNDLMNPSETLLSSANVFIHNQFELEQKKLLVHFSPKQLAFVQNLIEPAWFRHNLKHLCLEVVLILVGSFVRLTSPLLRMIGSCVLLQGLSTTPTVRSKGNEAANDDGQNRDKRCFESRHRPAHDALKVITCSLDKVRQRCNLFKSAIAMVRPCSKPHQPVRENPVRYQPPDYRMASVLVLGENCQMNT